MEKIMHQLIGSLSMFIPLFPGFYISQVVQDFFHQQHESFGTAEYSNLWVIRALNFGKKWTRESKG